MFLREQNRAQDLGRGLRRDEPVEKSWMETVNVSRPGQKKQAADVIESNHVSVTLTSMLFVYGGTGSETVTAGLSWW